MLSYGLNVKSNKSNEIPSSCDYFKLIKAETRGKFRQLFPGPVALATTLSYRFLFHKDFQKARGNLMKDSVCQSWAILITKAPNYAENVK